MVEKTYGRCKLTVADIKAIKLALRTPYLSLPQDLYARYGISSWDIAAIKYGRKYAWMTPDTPPPPSPEQMANQET